MFAMNNFKNGKATGSGNIPIELLRNSPSRILLLDLFNMCFTNGLVPDLSRQALINHIPKSNTKDPRGINFASVVYKLYCSILNNRLSAWADEQSGFRKGKGTIDHVSSLTSIIKNRRKKYCLLLVHLFIH